MSRIYLQFIFYIVLHFIRQGICGVILSYITVSDSQTTRTCRGVPCSHFFQNFKQPTNRVTNPQPRQRSFFNPSLFSSHPAFKDNPLFQSRTRPQTTFVSQRSPFFQSLFPQPRNQFQTQTQRPNVNFGQRVPVSGGGVIPTSADVAAIRAELRSMIERVSAGSNLFVMQFVIFNRNFWKYSDKNLMNIMLSTT